jgi:hypothetical protein
VTDDVEQALDESSRTPIPCDRTELRDPVDRREALKKMAAGGVTVIGASAVISSSVFADGGSPGSQPTNCATFPTAPWTTDNGITITMTAAATTCPVDFTPTTEYSYAVNNSLVVRSDATPSTVLTQSSFTTTSTVRVTSSGSTVAITGSPTGVTVTVIARRKCTNGSRVGWCCELFSYTGNYTSTNTKWNNLNLGNLTQQAKPSEPWTACNA